MKKAEAHWGLILGAVIFAIIVFFVVWQLSGKGTGGKASGVIGAQTACKNYPFGVGNCACFFNKQENQPASCPDGSSAKRNYEGCPPDTSKCTNEDFDAKLKPILAQKDSATRKSMSGTCCLGASVE